jgi:O-antigen ligase
MGRFLNPRAVKIETAGHGSENGGRGIQRPVLSRPAPVETTTVVTTPVAATPENRVSLAHKIGLVMMCVYLISGYATDLSYRFLGTKPYVSMVSGLALFVCFLLSGRALIALQTRVGRLWAFLMCWMMLATVFSRWRGGSADLMMDYLPKQHLVVFYLASVILTVSHFRTVLRACAFGGVVLLLTCSFFGIADDSGRYSISMNSWLGNPNDLAMQLLICMGFFIFLWRQPGLHERIVGILGLGGAAFFLLRTGSRGAMVALAVFCLVWIVHSRHRLFAVAGLAATGAALLLFVPGKTIERLKLIVVDPSTHAVSSSEEAWALSSQYQRQRLIKASLAYSLTNPLFGLGPGMFSQAIWEDGKKEGRHEASLGTHNSYTQISSECGVPAGLAFLAAVVFSIRSCFRIHRATAEQESQRLLHSISFALLVVMTAFAVDLFFHHVAYSANVSLLIGFGVLLELAGQRIEPAPATAASTSAARRNRRILRRIAGPA